MARLAARGIEVDVPPGWDARITRRETAPAEARTASVAGEPPQPPAMVHAASFSLPAELGDFGSGAVELMRSGDVFLSLIEFEADSLGTPLFSSRAQPRRVRSADFDPQALQRTLPGQAGTQVFFTAASRPFCLYVVLGSYAGRSDVVPVVNEVLEGIQIA